MYKLIVIYANKESDDFQFRTENECESELKKLQKENKSIPIEKYFITQVKK